MTTPELPEDKALVEIQAALAKTSVSTKRKVVEKFVLAALGSIPWVGGFISAAASIKVDQRNSEKDNLQTRWLEEHAKKMGNLVGALADVADRLDNLGDTIDERIQSEEYPCRGEVPWRIRRVGGSLLRSRQCHVLGVAIPHPDIEDHPYQPGNAVSNLVNKMDEPTFTGTYLSLFDQIWQDPQKLQDVTEQICDHIDSVYQENSPESIYFLMLYNIFNEFLDDINEDVLPNDLTGYQDTLIWKKLFNYQKDAATGIINKLETYSGCILADSVGLGKTFTALAVVKYYELRNKSVLVLCPKKLADNWLNYNRNLKTNIFSRDRFNYDVLCHTDLSRTSGESFGTPLNRINWGNYDLVVIDESHNFRNNDVYKDKETRYQKLMNKVIKEGVKTKVLMLSATPVNNRFNDLRNQLALAYEGESENLGKKLKTGKTIEEIFRGAQACFNTWSKLPPEERTARAILDSLDFDFFELLDSVTIARSRKHIQTFYDTKDIGQFPERRKPLTFHSPLTTRGDVMSFNDIFSQLSLLKLAVYAPISYILPSRLKKYEEQYDTEVSGGGAKLKQADREKSLQALMATSESLAKFKPLMVLRYSATHKTTHNKIHRLDALDAYNQKLVKKIDVRGIAVKGLAGTNAYLFLQAIDISTTKPPVARVELEIKLANGDIKPVPRKLGKGDNLFDLSNGLNQYQGYVVADINANTDTLSFTNGVELSVGEAVGDVNEAALRRIQIREAIKAHFEKEQELHKDGIKVLTLFFIDEVVKYRDYTAVDEKGEYARVFEEEYQLYLNEVLDLDETPYIQYLKGIAVDKTHSGYFSIDKKSKRLVDPDVEKRGENAGLSSDVDAYDLILKNKERLLSMAEPVRFIFSHSALREGWDNPNVFVICTLKHSDNTISRRQEVGRGLRLCVNQNGDRVDHPAIVHDVNVLTVVASESYKNFVAALQKDISESLSERPTVADKAYFLGKVLQTPTGSVTLTDEQATDIEFYLIQNGYVDKKRNITEKYHQAKADGNLAPLPDDLLPMAEQVIKLVDSVFSEGQMMLPTDGRKAKRLLPNANFDKQEFKALWDRINHKAAYSVHFDSTELVQKAIAAINDKDGNVGLRVTPLQYTIQRGEQVAEITADDLQRGDAFVLKATDVETNKISVHSAVKYDLIGKLAEGTVLTRRTIADILNGINAAVFAQYKTNPESFIAEAIRVINEQKATVIIEHLAYDTVEETFDLDIFTAGQTKQDLSKAGNKLERHIYDYVLTDSNIEREFVKELDASKDVVVYAKLPKGFLIPTPVGDYNPDWAISFKEGSIKHVYFVAETKGSMSTMDLRPLEATKIECARKFFAEVNKKYVPENVKYDVVNSFEKLMQIVR